MFEKIELTLYEIVHVLKLIQMQSYFFSFIIEFKIHDTNNRKVSIFHLIMEHVDIFVASRRPITIKMCNKDNSASFL